MGCVESVCGGQHREEKGGVHVIMRRRWEWAHVTGVRPFGKSEAFCCYRQLQRKWGPHLLVLPSAYFPSTPCLFCYYYNTTTFFFPCKSQKISLSLSLFMCLRLLFCGVLICVAQSHWAGQLENFQPIEG